MQRKRKIFKSPINKPINEELDNLEKIKSKVAEIKDEEASIIKLIREGLVNSVVVFIDLVDSSKFKIDNQSEPERWILRLKQFSDIVREYIENSNGKVVKYIGDELMGIFDQPTQIDDALSLIIRIKNIESNLSEITGFDTQVKIAIDYGQVFLLKYEGHRELDPQGTPIDRCARISKYCIPSSILSSYEFVTNCSFPKHWNKIGTIEMKGLGNHPVYQYGEKTIELKKRIEIEEEHLKRINDENSNLIEENQGLKLDKNEMISTIRELQKQLKAAGERPIIETDYNEIEEKEQQEIDYNKILDGIKKIKKLIHESGVSKNEYGRFLFLNEKGFAAEYNSFKSKTFDNSIEKDLVCQNSDDRFELNTANRRNIAVTKLIRKTERLLKNYVAEYGNLNDEDLFEYSFSDADFWEK
jgi:class 3 adenylate cyclase